MFKTYQSYLKQFSKEKSQQLICLICLLVDSRPREDTQVEGAGVSFPHYHQHGVQHIEKTQRVFTKQQTAAPDDPVYKLDALESLSEP